MHAVYNIFRSLQAKIHINPGRVVFDGARKDMTLDSLFDGSVTDLDDWKDFYPEAHEALPGKPIEPLGNPVRV